MIYTNLNIATPVGSEALHGADMGRILAIQNGEVEVRDGVFTYVGRRRPHSPGIECHDCGGRLAVPGFVDSHTHLLFAGTRQQEFMWRMRGDSYMSIMERGGGIVNTVSKTREASASQLAGIARHYLDRMLADGYTTVEVKSGYGLDLDAEIKMLEVIKALNDSGKQNLVATFLGAHAVPPEFKGRADEYVNFIIAEVLPKAKDLAGICDVFCEKGVFTSEQSRRLLLAAKDLGMQVKVHADEMSNTAGAQLAVELGALSADHLLHISDEGIAALAKSGTVATLLPLTAFCLREPYAPARKIIDAGGAVALASDFNPGSCFTFSSSLLIALACIYMRMTPEETLTAMTLNGAAALGLAGDIGSIEVGKKAHMLLLDAPGLDFLPYSTGMSTIHSVII